MSKPQTMPDGSGTALLPPQNPAIIDGALGGQVGPGAGTVYQGSPMSVPEATIGAGPRQGVPSRPPGHNHVTIPVPTEPAPSGRP
jgi:hypothetical protein